MTVLEIHFTPSSAVWQLHFGLYSKFTRFDLQRERERGGGQVNYLNNLYYTFNKVWLINCVANDLVVIVI